MKQQAIIFDLNGVFIQSPKLSDRFLEQFGVPTEKFLPALKEIMDIVRRPDAPEAYTLWKKYLDEWGVDLSEEEFYNFWFSAEKEVPELTSFARELKETGTKVIILSNNFKERAEYYKKTFPFLASFDSVYYSWQTGFVKPDPEAFKKVLNDLSVKPEECVFFDDSEKNIEVASSLGIQSYPFVDLRDIKEKLNSI